MSEQESNLRQTLSGLSAGEFIRFSDKRAVGRWIDTLRKLEQEGVLTMHMVSVDEQSTELRVFRTEG